MQLGITFEKLEWRVMNDGEYVPFWAMHHGYSYEPSLIMLIVLWLWAGRQKEIKYSKVLDLTYPKHGKQWLFLNRVSFIFCTYFG